jgi:tripartite-type tricarboxylate transporter receptor subunit TctC
MTSLRNVVVLVLVCACTLPAVRAQAADYPTKSIRLIVPFVAGGGTDVLARIISPRLVELLGQQIVVDNRGGAGSLIGTQMVASAIADGYTLGLFDTAFVIQPAVVAKLPYNSVRDFVFIAIIATSPTVLVAYPGLKVRTVPELVALAKAKPGQVKLASSGPGTAGYLTGEMFMAAAKINLAHIPFKGGGASVIDVLGGHTDITFATPGSVNHHIKAGTLVPLGVTGSRPSRALPDIPTFDKVGLASVDPGTFRFVTAPAALSAAISSKLIVALRAAMDTPLVQTRLAEGGFDPAFIPHPESSAYIEKEMRKWRQAVKDASARPN